MREAEDGKECQCDAEVGMARRGAGNVSFYECLSPVLCPVLFHDLRDQGNSHMRKTRGSWQRFPFHVVSHGFLREFPDLGVLTKLLSQLPS